MIEGVICSALGLERTIYLDLVQFFLLFSFSLLDLLQWAASRRWMGWLTCVLLLLLLLLLLLWKLDPPIILGPPFLYFYLTVEHWSYLQHVFQQSI